NVVGRGDVISAVFALAACLLWIRRPDREVRPAARTVLAAAALFALALFAKESAVMLPALLLLLDAARGRWKPDRATIRSYARAVAPSLAEFALVIAGYLGLRASVLDAFAPPRLAHAAHRLRPAHHHASDDVDLVRRARPHDSGGARARRIARTRAGPRAYGARAAVAARGDPAPLQPPVHHRRARRGTDPVPALLRGSRRLRRRQRRHGSPRLGTSPLGLAGV